MATKIEWSDESWNPVVGCSKCSPGCDNCYAETMAKRLKAMGHPKYQDVVDEKGWTGRTGFDEAELQKPLHWRKPRRIFVVSMGDLFGPKVPFEFICRVLDVARACKNHTFQFLTKRADRLLEFYQWHKKLQPMVDWERFENWHFGVSISNQAEDWKIVELLKIPAAKRWVSIEPMLGEIDIFNYPKISNYEAEAFSHYGCPDWYKPKYRGIDWVIVGCESGPKRRECKLEWVRSIVEQCKTANVPVFVKQLSINGKVSHDMAEWPEDLRFREWPRKAGK